jgi:hypothetical protein
MASMYGYVVMIIGLSLLLGMAGVSTSFGTMNSLTGLDTNSTTPGNITVTNLISLSTLTNLFLSTLLASLAGLTAFAVASLALRFSLADSLKLGVSTFLLGVAIADLVTIVNTAGAASGLGNIIYWIVAFIYIPLIGGFVINILNWIGGNS